ncbi:hypothetical protein ACEQPO_16080 [Bacillus sp. SL00103]
MPFTEQIGSLTEKPQHLRLYGQESLTSKFTQAFVARRWQKFILKLRQQYRSFQRIFNEIAGLVNYYNTENWTALQVTYDEELGRILELSACQNLSFSQPLTQKIVIPEEVTYVYLKVIVQKKKHIPILIL